MLGVSIYMSRCPLAWSLGISAAQHRLQQNLCSVQQLDLFFFYFGFLSFYLLLAPRFYDLISIHHGTQCNER
jgi:hypothetical protein